MPEYSTAKLKMQSLLDAILQTRLWEFLKQKRQRRVLGITLVKLPRDAMSRETYR